MQSFQMITWCSWIALFACAEAHGQPVFFSREPFDPATVAAYNKLGATFRGVGIHESRYELKQRRTAVARVLPGFHFRTHPRGKLPNASIPFGLSFAPGAMTDAGLKPLAALKKLSALNLQGTQLVTEEGIALLRKALPKCEISR